MATSLQRGLLGTQGVLSSHTKGSAQSASLPSAAQHANGAATKAPSRRVAVRAQETPVAAVADSAAHVDGATLAPSSNSSDVEDPSAFIADVASLVKLVDSRDIVELEMKHANYEILIRKKEAVEAATAEAQASSSGGYQTFPGPHVMAHTAFPFGAAPAYAAAPPAPAPAAPAAAAPAPPPPAPPKAPANAGLPPMLSPMAGTFYRSPAPGEPSFVKVGDRIQKGQVVCIIEAMKLMNEIEADTSGTVVEILAEDGKGVSIESPLLVIKP